MPKFTVETQSPLDPQKTYEKIKDFLQKGNDLQKFDSGMAISFDDARREAQAKGKQFTAHILIHGQGDRLNSNQEPSAPSLVSINIEIPLLLSPLKGKIQETLTKQLAKALS